jgi:hypothetical protein
VCVNNLAVHLRSADLSESLPLAERAATGFEARLGSEHAHTLAASANLANRLANSGDVAAAESIERRVVETLTSKVGPEHLDTRVVLANHAASLNALGRRREARVARERAAGRARLSRERPWNWPRHDFDIQQNDL